MKQYLLLLKSSDFNKSDNIWTSNAINLYVNDQYKNYSTIRSSYGINTLQDRTYVGTELTSPSSEDQSTPLCDTAIYATDIGEIIYDEATPSVQRFVDTTSRVDILSYRHIFTNIPGTISPTFNIQIYESDSQSGPWLRSSLSGDTNVIFIKDSKPYIKVELEIYADGIDINQLGLVFYLEIGIYDPVSPVISNSVRNILKRFPSWTALFEDSMEDATPEIAIPESTGGKLINALIGENLDYLSGQIDLHGINSYINSADINQLAWCFISYNVPANINTIIGDGMPLARTSSLLNFFNCRPNDYVFYYNALDRQIITMRLFGSISINGITYDQEPLNIYNDFDEFGARVSLPRLNLESNLNYKKRILDVTKNIPGVSIESYKKTLRRELDLWRAYGSTPDSDYVGATPEILEISDIENSSDYFSNDGKPLPAFEKLVENLNIKYPTNMGYVNWGDGVWDYSGSLGEGVGRIPTIYDIELASPSSLYQPGVGDFEDARLLIDPVESSTTSFSGYIQISGTKQTSTPSSVYSPINLSYSWYLRYLRYVADYEAGRADNKGVAVTYEVALPAHDNYTTPYTYYANLSYLDRDDMFVGNRFSSSHSASPEYNYIKIFDHDGLSLTNIEFREKVSNNIYNNTSATPFSRSISVYDASNVKVIFNTEWNQASQNYESIDVADYRLSFNTANSNYAVEPVTGSNISLSSPNIDYINSNLLVGSTTYSSKQEVFNSDILTSSMVINSTNDISALGINSKTIFVDDLLNAIIYPPDATPQYIYVNPGNVLSGTLYGGNAYSSVGGISTDPYTNNTYIVPSSPNIEYGFYDDSDTQIGSNDYFTSATINYSSTPYYIVFESATSDYYPFDKISYDNFSVSTTPNLFDGYIDENNNTYKDPSELTNYFFNQDKFLETITLNRDSFGFDANSIYNIDYINITTTPNTIEAYVNNAETLLDSLNSSIASDDNLYVDINARRKNLSDGSYNVGLNTGWLYLNQDEYYIYANPVTENYSGQFFEIELTSIPRYGAPIIVNVDSDQYRNILFTDSATPGKVSFYNKEVVYGNNGNSLYLSYENISDISVKDLYTGNTLFSNLSTSNNYITPFSEATPSVFGREYEVLYYVNNSFYVDKDVYVDSSDSYISKLYLSTTPNVSSNYEIIYESDYLNSFNNIDLDINQINNPLEEGYVYIDINEYEFDRIDAYLSPAHISDSVNDIMYLSIVSYDVNGNLKPNQSFDIISDDITADNPTLVTNDNGFATTILRYTGDVPSIVDSGSLTISGTTSTSTDGYEKVIPFKIYKNNKFNLQIKAVPVKYFIQADGVTKVSIVGRVYWKNRPFEHAIDLNWIKGRTLLDVFDTAATNTITTNSDGTFTITSITAENNTNPGTWFAKIEIDNDTAVRNLITGDGEELSENDITISGDIVYWNEAYDNVQYYNEQLPLPNAFTFSKQSGSDLIASPNFVYNYSNSTDIISNNGTPNWVPEKWVPLRKFDQYQLGLFGSTPNYISNLLNIHPDSGEQ